MADDVVKTACWEFNEAVSLLREARQVFVPSDSGIATEIDDGLPAIQAALVALAEWVAAGPQATPLFQLGEFTAHSGARLGWKIDCDALTADDWECLAAMAAEVLPPFGLVEGIPRGGLALDGALQAHATDGCDTLLIVDDVCTTGASLEDHRAGRDAIGVVAFARGPVPDWVTPLFQLAAADDTTTPQAPDEVLWTGTLGELSRAWQGYGNGTSDDPDRRVRVVAVPTDHEDQPDA